ncbi:MAG: GAF domain-containing protein, partial [Desulfobacteraceae bacterium]|nr:GAF domain-containing protein [Desulfobacteraceae bacterium]
MPAKPTYEQLEKKIELLEEEIRQHKTQDTSNIQAKKNYARFLKFLPVPVLVQKADGLITYLNPAFTQTFGWSLQELQGNEDLYVPLDIRDELNTRIKRMPRNKAILQMNSRRLVKNGNILNVSMQIGLDKDEDFNPTEMIIVLRDITMEQRSQKNRSAMNRISQALPRYPELKKLLYYVNTEIKALLGTEGANVILLDKDQKEFYFASSAHDDPSTRERIEKTRFNVDELISGQVVKTGKPLIVNDFSNHLDVYENRDKKVGYKIRNVILVPLQSKDRIIGVLSADNKKHGLFDQTDLVILNTIAGAVALSI